MSTTALFARIFPYRRRVRWVATHVPPGGWYRAALWMARVQGCVAYFVRGKRRLGLAAILDSWLLELTRRGPFPIPFEVAGAEHILPERPTLYCSPHRSLYDLAGSVFVERTDKPLIALSGKTRVEGAEEVVIFGSAIRAQPITADGNALLRIRNVLRGGGSVFANVDEDFGKPLSDRTLRIARKTHARIVFVWADLQPSGTPLVTFQPGSSKPDLQSAIREDLQFLLALQQDAMRMMERPQSSRAQSRLQRNKPKGHSWG